MSQTTEPTNDSAPPLALPPPPEEKTRTLNVQEGNSVAIDELGPLIVNSDGTLSRIQNWKSLSKVEQDRMIRLIVKRRNVQRLDKLKDQQQEAEAGTQAQGEEERVDA
ncbi:hypothetical protein NCC49_001189 [Naganishia albida]|nr:hypothetical protein NCC49_001189 [Naganishia albida]